MTAKDLIKKMMAAGWELKNIKGSHHHLIHTDHPGVKVQVPVHHGDLLKKTLHSIKKITGLDLK